MIYCLGKVVMDDIIRRLRHVSAHIDWTLIQGHGCKMLIVDCPYCSSLDSISEAIIEMVRSIQNNGK
jgi:hypothetical protein